MARISDAEACSTRPSPSRPSQPTKQWTQEVTQRSSSPDAGTIKKDKAPPRRQESRFFKDELSAAATDKTLGGYVSADVLKSDTRNSAGSVAATSTADEELPTLLYSDQDNVIIDLRPLGRDTLNGAAGFVETLAYDVLPMFVNQIQGLDVSAANAVTGVGHWWKGASGNGELEAYGLTMQAETQARIDDVEARHVEARREHGDIAIADALEQMYAVPQTGFVENFAVLGDQLGKNVNLQDMNTYGNIWGNGAEAIAGMAGPSAAVLVQEGETARGVGSALAMYALMAVTAKGAGKMLPALKVPAPGLALAPAEGLAVQAATGTAVRAGGPLAGLVLMAEAGKDPASRQGDGGGGSDRSPLERFREKVFADGEYSPLPRHRHSPDAGDDPWYVKDSHGVEYALVTQHMAKTMDNVGFIIQRGGEGTSPVQTYRMKFKRVVPNEPTLFEAPDGSVRKIDPGSAYYQTASGQIDIIDARHLKDYKILTHEHKIQLLRNGEPFTLAEAMGLKRDTVLTTPAEVEKNTITMSHLSNQQPYRIWVDNAIRIANHRNKFVKFLFEETETIVGPRTQAEDVLRDFDQGKARPVHHAPDTFLSDVMDDLFPHRMPLYDSGLGAAKTVQRLDVWPENLSDAQRTAFGRLEQDDGSLTFAQRAELKANVRVTAGQRFDRNRTYEAHLGQSHVTTGKTPGANRVNVYMPDFPQGVEITFRKTGEGRYVVSNSSLIPTGPVARFPDGQVVGHGTLRPVDLTILRPGTTGDRLIDIKTAERLTLSAHGMMEVRSGDVICDPTRIGQVLFVVP